MATIGRRSSFHRLVLGVVLLLSVDPSGASAAISIAKADEGKGGGEKEWCDVGQLLPRATTTKDPFSKWWNGDRSSEWSAEHVIEPPYGCNCASIKSRYFCPSLRFTGYPKWVPHSVADGACKSVTRGEMMADGPLPPDFKVLFYGNSHMRQVVESIMCLFQNKIAVKRVTRFSPAQKHRRSENGNADTITDDAAAEVSVGGLPSPPYTKFDTLISGDAQCRACFDPLSPPETVNSYEREMLENECVAEGGGDCRCADDHAEFFFDNGAIVHYQFAANNTPKSIADAVDFHGGTPLTSYDAVFANIGNRPHMLMETVLDVAAELQAAGVPLFWLSTYEGNGVLGKHEDWSDEQVVRFRDSGARFVGIDRMTRGLGPFTKGLVENVNDSHFCLPGPPNEIGLLLLKLVWAVHLHDNLK